MPTHSIEHLNAHSHIYIIIYIDLAYNMEEMTVENEDESEDVEEQDDSDLTFSQHNGNHLQIVQFILPNIITNEITMAKHCTVF